MNRISRLFLAATTLLALAGCNYSVEELTNDHELRMKVLADCVKMDPEEASESQNCRNAMEAQEKQMNQQLRDLKDAINKR